MLLCAKVVNIHGIAGEVKAIYYADGPSFFDNIKTLYLSENEPLTVRNIRPHKGSIIIKFKEIDNVDAAERMRGKDLYVKRENADPLPEGRYYVADIIGLSVFTDEGRDLGKVTDVFKTGSNDVYTVKNADGKEYLIPVIDEVVISTDIDAGKIIIKPMKGLLGDED